MLSGSLEVRGCEIKFIKNKSFLDQKNPRGFVTETLKVGITNPQGIFDQRDFYLINLISQPLTLRPPLSSKLRLNEKSWGGAQLLGSKSLDFKCSNENFFN